MTHEAMQRAMAGFEAALKELDKEIVDIALVRSRILHSVRQLQPIALESPALARILKRYTESQR